MKTKRLLVISLLLFLMLNLFVATGVLVYHKLLSGVLICFSLYVVLFKHGWLKGTIFQIVICFMLYQLTCCFIHGEVATPMYVNILETLCWPDVFLIACYVFMKNSSIDNRERLLLFFAAAFILNIVIYVLDFYKRMYVLQGNDMRSNLIFFIVCLTPFAALIENNKTRYLIYLVIFAFSVLSFKRTAMLVCVAVVATELFLNFDFKKNKGRNIFFSLAFVFWGYFAVSQIESHFGLSVFERFEAIGADGGSGRDEIYIEVWNHMQKLPIEYVVCGRGHNGVKADGIVTEKWDSSETLSAHTDFLEVIYDYGIIGAILYISFIVQIVKVARFWKNKNFTYYRAMIISLMVFLLISATSHLILYASYFTYIVIFWAFMYIEKVKYRSSRTVYQ